MDNTLKLYEGEILADPDIQSNGFYMLVLAVDILAAMVHIERAVDEHYGDGLGTIFVETGECKIKEFNGPFRAGTVLCNISYPHDRPTV